MRRSNRREGESLAPLKVHRAPGPTPSIIVFLPPWQARAHCHPLFIEEETDSQPWDLTFFDGCMQGGAEQRSHSLGPSAGEVYFDMSQTSKRKTRSDECHGQLLRRLSHSGAGCHARDFICAFLSTSSLAREVPRLVLNGCSVK